MHWLAPWWWLLLLPLAGALIVLYLLKLRRRDVRVPSVILWEQALQDLQANAPLQKLRKNLLLLLQLIVLLLAVAALSRPALLWARPGGQSVILVVDASASMQSTDVAPSRFAAAKRQAQKTVEALGPRDAMMIIAIGGATRALTPFTTDKSALRAVIDRLQVTDARADLQDALALAAGMKKGAVKPSVDIISDGALPAVTLPADFDLPVTYERIGKRSENVGIVMLDVRKRISSRGGFEGVLTLVNTGKSAQTGTLEMAINGSLRDARDITLKAGERRTEILEDLPTDGGILRVALDMKDDLAVDNSAEIILPKLEPLTVTLATGGNIFLQTALSLDPTLKVTTVDTVPAALPAGSVLIADNVPAGSLPKGVNALYIGPDSLKGGGADVPAVAKTLKDPAIADWDRRNPALTHVDLTGIHIGEAPLLALPPDAQSLIDAPEGPLAASAHSLDRRAIFLGWDLHHSDFPLRVGFPIFVHNCLDWLSGQRERGGQANLHTGQIAQVAVPAGVKEVTLTEPGGAKEQIPVTGSPLAIDRLTRAGLYHITAPGVDQQFSANLLDSGESNLLPNDNLQFTVGKKSLNVSPKGLRTEHELWRTLLLLVLALLCVEWWVFHRRIG